MPTASTVKSVMTLQYVFAGMKRWIRSQLALQDLRRLDDVALRDIGLTRGDIYRTAMRETTCRNDDGSGPAA
jgi:uncharacterized protein YjiS (DUF1127 family)